MFTTQEWHRRYAQQAGWTQDIRRYIFAQVNMERARRVIEIGCGTGAILTEVENIVPLGLHGLDIQHQNIRLAQENAPLARLTTGDALDLPYAAASFDVTICHFLLLWVRDPARAIQEMRRVTRPGGYVVALAEPDYGGRIDYPDELVELGKMQTAALQAQGADPLMGRKLSACLGGSGLIGVQVGLLGGFWNKPQSADNLELEWQVLAEDLGEEIAPDDLSRLQQVDLAAWRQNQRILYIPTFYGWGQVPEE